MNCTKSLNSSMHSPIHLHKRKKESIMLQSQKLRLQFQTFLISQLEKQDGERSQRRKITHLIHWPTGIHQPPFQTHGLSSLLILSNSEVIVNHLSNSPAPGTTQLINSLNSVKRFKQPMLPERLLSQKPLSGVTETIRYYDLFVFK